MYNNLCLEDINNLSREIEKVINNCEKCKAYEEPAQAMLFERLMVARGLINSVATAIHEEVYTEKPVKG